MKGSRERLGMGRMERTNVTWAPDVYDPPATSMSHTVRNHHQRPKSKKKDHKHRRKSRSTRGSGSDKKHHANWKNSNNVDLLHLRLQVPAGNRSPHAEGFDQMNLEAAAPGCSLQPSDSFDRAAADVATGVGISSNQDSKCGRNFFGSSLAKLHLSATEAT
ncbi:hypothetical protein ACLOJK_001706 [Asimina triloba]